ASYHMVPVLEWLWDVAARPSLEALGFDTAVSDNNWPHVWWVPTGPLSHLPLHAAGRYEDCTETVLDRVMSSYSLSVKALIYDIILGSQQSLYPILHFWLLCAKRQVYTVIQFF